MGLVAEAGGDSLAEGEGVVEVVDVGVVVLDGFVRRVLRLAVEDLLGVVHHLLHIGNEVVFQESALQGEKCEAVVGKGGEDGGVADVVPGGGEGHDGVEAEGEEGLPVGQGDKPEGVVGVDPVVDGGQGPVAIAVDKPHVEPEAVVDGAVAVVEDVAVVADIVLEATVDNDIAMCVDEFDTSALFDSREAVGENPGMLVGGLYDEVPVAHVEVAAPLAVGEVDEGVALEGGGDCKNVLDQLLAVGIGDVAVVAIIVAVVEEDVVRHTFREVDVVALAEEAAAAEVDVVEEIHDSACRPEEDGDSEGGGDDATQDASKLRAIFHAEEGSRPVDNRREDGFDFFHHDAYFFNVIKLIAKLHIFSILAKPSAAQCTKPTHGCTSWCSKCTNRHQHEALLIQKSGRSLSGRPHFTII